MATDPHALRAAAHAIEHEDALTRDLFVRGRAGHTIEAHERSALIAAQRRRYDALRVLMERRAAGF